MSIAPSTYVTLCSEEGFDGCPTIIFVKTTKTEGYGTSFMRNKQPAYTAAVIAEEAMTGFRSTTGVKLTDYLATFQATNDRRLRGVGASDIKMLPSVQAIKDSSFLSFRPQVLRAVGQCGGGEKQRAGVWERS